MEEELILKNQSTVKGGWSKKGKNDGEIRAFQPGNRFGRDREPFSVY